MTSHIVTLGLGANVGDREMSLLRAIETLKSALEDIKASKLYETLAVGKAAYGTYLNAVVEGKCSMSKEALESYLKKMEYDFGRDSEARERGDVPLDVDIVLFDAEIVRPRDFSQSFFRIGYESLHPEICIVI